MRRATFLGAGGSFLSQAELARRSGVHPLTITRLESGRRRLRLAQCVPWLARWVSLRVSWPAPTRSPRQTVVRFSAHHPFSG
jgi:hypothetical protein